jgi:class 3 adenylate cyclase
MTANAYDAVHKQFHGHFVQMMRDMAMYDLFLIDDRSGDILYSVEKETDFATNLETGPYRNSVLARAFRTVRDRPDDQRGVVFVDFEHYTPSFGAPAAFLAAPVYKNGDRIGIVAGQLSIEAMNAALTSSGNWANEGLGKTGEVYLVGDDNYARSDSRFLIEDKPGFLTLLSDLGVPEDQRAAIDLSGHSILNQHYSTLAVERALAGETGTDTIDDYRGVEVLSAYAPIDFGGHRWAIIAEKDTSEALGPLHDLRQVILLATGAISIGITIFALIAARAFVAPLMRLQQGVERLKAGETHFAVEVKGDDEFATLGTAFNGMLTEMVRRNGIIDAKTAEYEKLLRNVLPDAVADRFSGGELMVADTFENVSIVYAVISGLDQVQRDVSAGVMIRLMNELIDAFDEAAERHGVEKIKTIGDAYLAACGLSTPRLDHRQRAAAFAAEMQSIQRRFNDAKGLSLSLNVGLANGEVDAGIVGRKRFVYEILGDCVSEARRLALADEGPNIRMSEAMGAALAPQDSAGAIA